MNQCIINFASHYHIASIIEHKKNNVMIVVPPNTNPKRLKLSQIIYPIASGNLESFKLRVQEIQPTIDCELLWSMIEDEHTKFSIDELCTLYFGDDDCEINKTALLFSLNLQTTNFIDYNNGFFKKCTPDEQKERELIFNKQQEANQLIEEYYNAFINKLPPENFDLDNKQIIRLLNKPDKNTLLYKAILRACKTLELNPIELFLEIGLIKSLEHFFLDSFLTETCPAGSNYSLNSSPSMQAIIECTVHNKADNIFSIDDSTTTEIDDAFSVAITNDGYLIGIHIAAPALDINLADMVADNISTIYYPENKITMLPKSIIDKYTLNEGTQKPATSIYFELDQQFNIKNFYSKLEYITVNKNLRTDQIEALMTEENLLSFDNTSQPLFPFHKELSILYNFALSLEQIRGRSSVNNLNKDFIFSFVDSKIQIKPRIRGNPTDKLVSELMILANCSWGRMLTNSFIPAIYRVKQPGKVVMMTTAPDSHTGLNVSYYTWATSPLRRSVDYINQRQILSLITHQKINFSSLDPTLLDVVDNFDQKYAKYLEFQNKMERFWALKYLLQENISQVQLIIFHKLRGQFDIVPLELDLHGIISQKSRGTILKLKIYNINLTNLTFDYKILGVVGEDDHNQIGAVS